MFYLSNSNENQEVYANLEKLEEVLIQLDIQKSLMIADNKSESNFSSISNKRINYIQSVADNVIDVIAYLNSLTNRKGVISEFD